jgi:ADP-heptose:LPS heptosyltransferase
VKPTLADWLRAHLALALLSLLNGLLSALRLCLWPKRPRHVERVGVYRIGNIGDIACAVPALYAIRRTYPQARLTLVTSPGGHDAPGARELLADADWIDEVFVYHIDDGTDRSALLEQIRQRCFDLWIVLPPTPGRITRSLRDMLAARGAGVRWGYGWQLDRVRIWANAQSTLLACENETAWLMSIVKRAGMCDLPYSFPLPLSVATARVDALFSKFREEVRGPLIAMAPGAKRPANRWPIERFCAVASSLVERGFGLITLGASADAPACNKITDATGGSAINLAGHTSLLESCEILRRCRLLICNDSGVQHLAAAVGTPCLSIFSFRDFRGRWWPYGERNVVLQRWVPCGPCLLNVCPYNNQCLTMVASDEVLESALKMLESVQAPKDIRHCSTRRNDIPAASR